MGPIIPNAWSYSLETGSLPSSHLESGITLLPKEGKDTKNIKKQETNYTYLLLKDHN